MEISQLRPPHPPTCTNSHYHRPHLINTAVWRISIEMPNSCPLCYHRHKPTSYQQWSSPIPKQAWRYNHNMRWHHVSAAGLWMNLYLQHVGRTACEWFLLTLDCLFVCLFRDCFSNCSNLFVRQPLFPYIFVSVWLCMCVCSLSMWVWLFLSLPWEQANYHGKC